MKFPITREELQSYNTSIIMQQKIEENINIKISEIIKNICDDFEQNLLNNLNQKKFVWYWRGRDGIDTIIRYSSGRYGLSDTYGLSYIENKKNDFMNLLRELFIGCNIICDPLQTYIIIDWF
jgi:hypothetical protein